MALTTAGTAFSRINSSCCHPGECEAQFPNMAQPLSCTAGEVGCADMAPTTAPRAPQPRTRGMSSGSSTRSSRRSREASCKSRSPSSSHICCTIASNSSAPPRGGSSGCCIPSPSELRPKMHDIIVHHAPLRPSSTEGSSSSPLLSAGSGWSSGGLSPEGAVSAADAQLSAPADPARGNLDGNPSEPGASAPAALISRVLEPFERLASSVRLMKFAVSRSEAAYTYGSLHLAAVKVTFASSKCSAQVSLSSLLGLEVTIANTAGCTLKPKTTSAARTGTRTIHRDRRQDADAHEGGRP
mmetsp:Transcript_35969/g.107436  ORF Transcript_35969/g.107436 Transcript_35969/m.107436 type:complete len:298 (-) Transcript_35969:924-1817(-)